MGDNLPKEVSKMCFLSFVAPCIRKKATMNELDKKNRTSTWGCGNRNQKPKITADMKK